MSRKKKKKNNPTNPNIEEIINDDFEGPSFPKTTEKFALKIHNDALKSIGAVYKNKKINHLNKKKD